MNTGDIVDAYIGSSFLGRGVVVALKESGSVAEVETFDLCRYACKEEDLVKVVFD